MDERPAVDFNCVATELGLSAGQIGSVTRLLDEGNTVPFITRYRKEQTSNLDEEQIRKIQQRIGAMRQLAERAATILRLIETQNKLTPALRTAVEQADSLKRLEDLYLPYRPKRRSRATIAKERGLAPLAIRIWKQDPSLSDLEAEAAGFVDVAKELPVVNEVLKGAADILVERIGEDSDLRARCRRIVRRSGQLTVSAARKAKGGGQEFRDYFDYTEAIAKIPPHRVLALNRGEKAGALKIRFDWDAARARTEVMINLRLTDHRFSKFMESCVADALTRYIQPALEREFRREMTESAELHAVQVFARNLKNLLLQPPLGNERLLAVDPGFRTGCKIAVLDEVGNMLENGVFYVTGKDEKRAAERQKLAGILESHNCRLIAIGNGTACRETEEFVSEMISEMTPDVRFVIVNEAGASIYSTSSVARDEFPEHDATVRGTISIGRRLLDPLSELVKIDPQHIGVGMYQHDVNVKLLKHSLDEVIESCVNYVGVDLNTASASLLRYVSGFNQLVARRVVEWREENGRFKNRNQLRDVSGIGDTTFTQAAGFLKIQGGDEPLDGTWIHPESYETAHRVLERLSIAPESLVSEQREVAELRNQLSNFDAASTADELGVGLHTFEDILDALARPGRDPRSKLSEAVFKKGILKLDDLEEGLELKGTVLNVVDFGAFVDIGLKDSGLVHISHMSKRYVASPHDVVSVGDVVTVWVLSIDRERRRVSLTMLKPEAIVAVPAPESEVVSESDVAPECDIAAGKDAG